MQTLRPGRQHQLLRLQLSRHGAPTGCMFSILKSSEKQVGSHQKKKRPVFDMYAPAVTSFVESYIAANQIYPNISEVMQITGGSRSTIRRILSELHNGKNEARSEEVCVGGQDDMKEMHTSYSLSTCVPSNITNVEDSALSCSGKFEEPAEEVDSAQVVASVYCTDAEMENARTGISTPDLEKKGFSVLRDRALSTLLDQAKHSGNKAEANRRVAPLMEVLQQTSSGSSRRVHLSDCRGIDNELSWEKTLQSITPTSVGGEEARSGLKNEQLKVNRENMVHQFIDEQPKVNKENIGHQFIDEQPKVDRENMGHLSFLSKDCKKSPVYNANFTVKVISSKLKSVLDNISGVQFAFALKQQANIFKNLRSLKLYRRTLTTNAYAILQFKDYENMKKALELQNVIIAGETLGLQKYNAATVNLTRTDASQPEAFGESSVFQEVMEGMAGSLKKEVMSSKTLHSPCYPCVEDKQSDVYMQGQHSLHPSFLQTISIQECPKSIPLESITSFFSVFGKVQTSYEAFCHGKSPGIQILVEFENESDKEMALKVQQFIVDGCSFQLRQAPSSLVVQLKCKRSDFLGFPKTVAKACKQYGVLEKFYLKTPQIAELTFSVNERHRMSELLKSLHEDTYLKGRWDISAVYEGYIRADFEPIWCKENLKNIVIVLNELSAYVTSLLQKDI